MIWIIIILFLIFYLRPWIDIYTDYRGIKHIILWYTNLKGERNYINIGGQN